ncbi:MAG: membrane-bound lytic murein transglycosylase B [Glomeribacter sp. 1016415]|nr:membrane-bound lytic murein transglycosylase B [Glomeribacter sp. 1016415]
MMTAMRILALLANRYVFFPGMFLSGMFVAGSVLIAGCTPAQSQAETSAQQTPAAKRYQNNPAVEAFISDLAARHQFEPSALRALFEQAKYSDAVIKLEQPSPTPAPRNWHAYQSRFLNAERINAGVHFWRTHQAALQRAHQEFGVPPEIIVGIIGVETFYGRNMGNYPVLDVLTTLTFDYPARPNQLERGALFRKNLEAFLLWTRAAGLDPTRILGSYNGAVGIAQFMPSSVMQYAIDYDGDQKVDLYTSVADAIGSIANYLRQHGWEAGRPVIWEIASDNGSLGIAQAGADGKIEPRRKLRELIKAGLLLNEKIDIEAESDTLVNIIDLPIPQQPTEYKLGLRNFAVITNYNRSFFYALSVYQLGQQVKQRLQMNETSRAMAIFPPLAL